MTRPIRVLLADDHQLFRAGIRALMHTMEGVEIVAEATNGREAIELCKSDCVDVILMDIMMPQLNGLDATARLAAISPQTRTIILSMNANEEYVLQAFRCGAAGYLLKNISPSELEQAVRAVARGDTYVGAAISKHVITAYLQRRRRVGQPFRSLDFAAARSLATRCRGVHEQGDRQHVETELEDGGDASQPIDGCTRYPRHRWPGAVCSPHGTH